MQTARLTTVLIDLDGTLTDPQVGITTCIRHALQQMGQPLPPEQDLRWCIGPPLKQSLAQLLQTADDQLAEQALQHYRERFGRVGLFENEVYPDIVPTLQQLHPHFRLFVATAKPTVYAERIIRHFGLDGFFAQIYGSELTGERTNKADLLAHLLQQQQLSAAECVMVGDREHDILGARRNGIAAIGVTYGYGSREELQAAQPDALIDRFAQLPHCLSP